MARAFFRYLDTNGDGTGNKSAAVDGSDTPVEFKIIPESDETLELIRMMVFVEDAGSFDSGSYGNGISMANGMTFELRKQSDDSVVQDFFDGEPIKTSGHWARQCHDAVHYNYGQGNEYLTVRWTFSKAGKPLYVEPAHYLALTVRDDLTGLVDHRFQVQGVPIKKT